MVEETKVSKNYKTVVPSAIRKVHNIIPGDILEWTGTDNGILMRPKKKRTLQDIKGLVKSNGDAVESKRKVQKGLK